MPQILNALICIFLLFGIFTPLEARFITRSTYSCEQITITVDSIFENELEETDWAREVTPYLYQQSIIQSCEGLENILTLAGIFYFNDEKFNKAADVFEQADSLFSLQGAKNHIYVFHLLFDGLTHLSLKDNANALLLFEKASDVSKRIGFYTGQMLSLINFGISYSSEGDIAKGEEYLLRAIALTEKSERKSMNGYAFLNLGSIYVKKKNYYDAIINFEKARAIWEELGFTKGLFYLESNFAILERTRQHYTAYENHLKNAIKYVELDSNIHRSVSYVELGFHYIKQQKEEEALYYLQKGIENHDGINQEEFYGLFTNLISIYARQNDENKLKEIGYKLLNTYRDKLNNVSGQANQWQRKEFILESKIIENEKLKKDQEAAIDKIRLRNILLLLLTATLILISFLVRSKMKSNRIKEQLHIEQLRSKLSKDLHDDVGTILAGISMQTQMLTFKSSKVNHDIADQIVKSAAQAASMMRDMVWALDARNDSFVGLEYKMKDFLSIMFTNSQLKSNFKNEIPEHLPLLNTDIKHGLYIVFKESINNVIKHSDATKIEIILRIVDKQLKLNLIDNGSHKPFNKSGQGLRNMDERIKDLGGSFSFGYNNGYETLISIPLKES